MKASEILKENVNGLMEARGWTSNKPLIAASEGRLSNGTLGRIRGDGENTKLSQVDELAAVFGFTPSNLLAPGLTTSPAVPSLQAAVARIAKALAHEMPDDIRQDAADLLAKLAHRHGAVRHQAELTALLEAAVTPVKVTTQTGGHLGEVAHVMIEQNSDDGLQTPSPRGVEGEDKWDESRFKKSRPRTGKASGAGVTTSMHTPKPAKEKRK